MNNLPTLLGQQDFNAEHSDMLAAARDGRTVDPKAAPMFPLTQSQISDAKAVLAWSENNPAKVAPIWEAALSPRQGDYFMWMGGLQTIKAFHHPLPHVSVTEAIATDGPVIVPPLSGKTFEQASFEQASAAQITVYLQWCRRVKLDPESEGTRSAYAVLARWTSKWTPERATRDGKPTVRDAINAVFASEAQRKAWLDGQWPGGEHPLIRRLRKKAEST